MKNLIQQILDHRAVNDLTLELSLPSFATEGGGDPNEILAQVLQAELETEIRITNMNIRDLKSGKIAPFSEEG